jgi:hypothetical protein
MEQGRPWKNNIKIVLKTKTKHNLLALKKFC